MKKLGVLVIVLLLAVVMVLSACQSAPAPAPAPSPAPAPAPAPAPTPAPAPAPTTEPEYEWTYGSQYAQGSTYSIQVELMCDLIEQYSNGRIMIPNRYYGGAVGGASELTEKLQTGDIEIAWNSPYPSLNPKFTLGAAPALASNWEELEALYANYRGGIVDRYICEGMEDIGIKVAMTFGESFYGVITRDKPIYKPADLNGVKLRSKSDPIVIAVMESLGALPNVMSSSEQYSAIQTGTVDGTYTAPEYAKTVSLQEICKYYTDIRWWSYIGTAGMPLELYNSLPDDLKEAVDRAAWVAQMFSWTYFHTEWEQAQGFLEGEGVTIIRLTEAERQAFFDVIQPEKMWEEYIKPTLTAAEWEEFKAEVARVQALY